MKYTYWYVITESADDKYPVGSTIGLKNKQTTDLYRANDETRDFERFASVKYLKRFPTEMQKTNPKELGDALSALAKLAMVQP